MRKLSAISLLLALVLFVSGCGVGSYMSGGKKPDGSLTRPDDGDKNPPEKEEEYKAYVYLNNVPFSSADREITVVWRGADNEVRVPLGDDGSASAGALDGDFSVTLEGLPDKYAYDENAYTATADSRVVSIALETVQKPESGDGTKLYRSEGCYMVKYDGYYRTEIKSKWTKVYYEYTPTAAGFYSIESKVSIYAGMVNPTLDIYNGNTAFKIYAMTLDGGGAALDGGYTKNFRYECRIDKTEVGNSFTVAVGAQTKDNKYPVSVTFRIRYEGEYSSSNSDIRIIRAKEAYMKPAEPGKNQKFVFADRGTKVFDARGYKFNPVTETYHVYDETLYADDRYGWGAGYGAQLLCALKTTLPSYPKMTLTQPSCMYNFDKVGEYGQNYFRLYNMWIEEEQKFAVFDYTKFIRDDYYGYANSQGMVFVTRELQRFLQKFAENHSLWVDGMDAEPSTPEDLGYSANQDALWLFACGYYE